MFYYGESSTQAGAAFGYPLYAALEVKPTAQKSCRDSPHGADPNQFTKWCGHLSGPRQEITSAEVESELSDRFPQVLQLRIETDFRRKRPTTANRQSIANIIPFNTL
jgi:hypothetical protein